MRHRHGFGVVPRLLKTATRLVFHGVIGDHRGVVAKWCRVRKRDGFILLPAWNVDLRIPRLQVVIGGVGERSDEDRLALIPERSPVSDLIVNVVEIG